MVRRASLTVVSAGHPSTCPRMVKAADAAADAGYDVRFVTVDYVDWATSFDTAVQRRRRWRWAPVRVSRADRPLASRLVSARYRAARAVSLVLDPARVPFAVAVRAYARTHAELVSEILREPFDLIYGGTVGALAAVAEAGERARKPFALDFEDFHPAESEEADADLTHALAARVTRSAAARLAFATAASAPIADAYARQFHLNAFVVHNVAPRPRHPPRFAAADGPLRLYWFSQVVGPRRGLEDVVRAVAAAQIPAELHLRGAERQAYVADLRQLAERERANLRITVHPPADPDQMVALCGPYDVGVSPEQEGVLNRALCLPNKPLTYLAAGLAIAATDTVGQKVLADTARDAVWWYRPGDIRRFAEGLRWWHEDRAALARARRCSHAAAVARFHWEHPLERGALLEAIEQSLS